MLYFKTNHLLFGPYPKIINEMCFNYNSMMQKVSKKETDS